MLQDFYIKHDIENCHWLPACLSLRILLKKKILSDKCRIESIKSLLAKTMIEMKTVITNTLKYKLIN